MKVIQDADLQTLTRAAKSSSRRRSHLNIHPQESDAIQRLCLAMEPGTYVRPHRHSETGKWELLVIIQGAAEVLLFQSDGLLNERILLRETAANRIIEIPEQAWHSVIAKQDKTILFEVKPGPYTPLDDKHFADWAPAENDPQVTEFIEWFTKAEIGSRPPARLEELSLEKH